MCRINSISYKKLGGILVAVGTTVTAIDGIINKK